MKVSVGSSGSSLRLGNTNSSLRASVGVGSSSGALRLVSGSSSSL